jgi:hypothetical protein
MDDAPIFSMHTESMLRASSNTAFAPVKPAARKAWPGLKSGAQRLYPCGENQAREGWVRLI